MENSEDCRRRELPGGYYAITMQSGDLRYPPVTSLFDPTGKNLHVPIDDYAAGEATHDQRVTEGLQRRISGLKEYLADIETALQVVSQQADNAPYLEKHVTEIVRLYNPNYGDNRLCVCGHTYAKHFDPFEEADSQDAGCKYCGCETFQEAPQGETR